MTQSDAFEVLNTSAKSNVLVLCDHASNRVPEAVNGGTLGISKADMHRHIAFDIGARATALNIARTLDAKMIASRFSRLVIDPNRGEDDPTLLMKIYDHTIITGNRFADAVEKARRINAYYRPYHSAIDTALAEITARGETPVILSIHSFTPRLNGRPERPWHIGVLWDSDPRIPVPLMENLGQDRKITVGNNAPYSGELQGDTMYTHATKNGYPHVLIEFRHDLIDTPEGQEKWASVLTTALSDILETL